MPRKTELVVAAVAVMFVVGIGVGFGMLLMHDHEGRESKAIAACAEMGGKLMTVYDPDTFRKQSVTCVPAGVTAVQVEKP